MRLICELCDTDVWQASKETGIWICRDCEIKYTEIKERKETNERTKRRTQKERITKDI